MRVRISLTFRSAIATRCLAALMAVLICAGSLPLPAGGESTASESSVSKKKKIGTSKTSSHTAAKAKPGRASAGKRRSRHRGTKAQRHARTARLKLAFVASTELRPMAQQLATMRSPAAYAGVTTYAHRHTGDAAAAAYIALGRAYLLDKRYAEASSTLRQAKQASEVLADYADYLAAEAEHNSGNEAAAEALLRGFTTRYPDSIFELLATIAEDAADLPNYELTQAKIAFALQRTQEATEGFKHLLLSHPLSPEAGVARARLTAMGAEITLTPAELRSLGDAYYNAGRYSDASEQYRALARNAGVDTNARNGYAVAAAACDLKLKRLTDAQAQALADTPDENGARRLYLLMELARNRNDEAEQQRIVTQMESRFPQSQWLAEALFSSGNMYMLRRDYPTAVNYYSYLAAHFPASKTASAAHWRAGWLCYRQGLFSDATRMFDDQIRLYPTATETSAALYWRAR